MAIDDLGKLAALIKQERNALLLQWRQQVRQLPSAQHLDTPTLNDHVPGLLDELASAIKTKPDEMIPEALSTGSSPAHGLQRAQEAYDIEEVVAEYNVLRGCIQDLAEGNGLALRGEPLHILNRVLDAAIGSAVRTYAAQKALEVQKRREEYLAFVAHDLRTPLNAMSLATRFLETVFAAQSPSNESARMLKTLRRNLQQLDALVGKVIEENTNLLAESGIRLQRRALDLWPLVESVVYDLHPVAGTTSARVINEVPDDLVVYADASVLRRVFQNLITNAIQYTPHGEVILGAKALGEEGEVECWVRDTGAGIPADRLDRVFDPLETDPGKEDGLGLGLAIVKTFVEAHEGKVTVESQEGVGSTFRFTLPGKSK